MRKRNPEFFQRPLLLTNWTSQRSKAGFFGKRTAGKQRRVWKSEKKQGVWWNSNGFTLIESLIVLMVFSACAASMPLLYEGADRIIKAAKAEKNIEWELFIIQLRNEMHMSSNWHLSETKLTYSTTGSNDVIVSISQYRDKIRRQVQGQGHEVLLQNVKTASFSSKGGKVYIHVTFSNGEQEGASMYPFYKQSP
jgi:competence protein ComGF